MSYENKHVFRDGAIVLYTRNGQPVFHARLKVENRNGYIVKSTKCADLLSARKIAENLHDDLRYKARHGLEVRAHTFESVYKKWVKQNQPGLSEPRFRYIDGTANRYLLPFFGKMSIEGIHDTEVGNYWPWRLNYWISGDGVQRIEAAQKSRTTAKRPYKQKLGNVAKRPSQKTLSMEQTVIRQIFGWAHRSGIINRLPMVKVPKVSKSKEVARRPAFELDEWRKLIHFMREWVSENHLSSFHLFHRRMLRTYVLFMGTSGLRPNEARQLRWQDVTYYTDKSGIKYVVLHIAPTTKTGERECIPALKAEEYLSRVKSISRHTEPSDFIFCDQTGRCIENFGKTFKKILIATNLLKDRFGRVRTIYSLRHTYATLKLLHGKADIELLAQNMGTSPAQIYKHYRHITVQQNARELGGDLNKNLSRSGHYW